MESPNDPTGPNASEKASENAPSGSRQPATTPFDHPLFLPGLLGALALWFGYDGWLNSDPDMQKHLAFNRWGAGILVVLTAWFGYRGLNELKQAKQDTEKDPYPPIE